MDSDAIFKVGDGLEKDAPSHVERAADGQLYEASIGSDRGGIGGKNCDR